MGELRRWVVTGTSMVVEAEDWEEAIDRAQETSGWQWEAEEWTPHPGIPERLRTFCGCGTEIVWTAEGWQHDAAPYIWGGDHDVDEPEPDVNDPARRYWDIQDGVVDEPETEHPYAEVASQKELRDHLLTEHGVSQEVATALYDEGDHHLRTLHRVFHRQPEEGD